MQMRNPSSVWRTTTDKKNPTRSCLIRTFFFPYHSVLFAPLLVQTLVNFDTTLWPQSSLFFKYPNVRGYLWVICKLGIMRGAKRLAFRNGFLVNRASQ